VSKELNMAQALHVEPKLLMRREIHTSEFFVVISFQLLGKV